MYQTLSHLVPDPANTLYSERGAGRSLAPRELLIFMKTKKIGLVIFAIRLLSLKPNSIYIKRMFIKMDLRVFQVGNVIIVINLLLVREVGEDIRKLFIKINLKTMKLAAPFVQNLSIL